MSTREYMAAWRDANREKVRAYSKDWRSKNRERDVEQNRQERRRVRDDVFMHYSGGSMACCKCGFADHRILQLDHINDDGAEERRKFGSSRTSAGCTFYRWLRKNGYPQGYQVLCPNCNWLKEIDRRGTYEPA